MIFARLRKLAWLVGIATLLALASAFGSDEPGDEGASDLCAEAAAHLDDCFGPQAADAFTVVRNSIILEAFSPSTLILIE